MILGCLSWFSDAEPTPTISGNDILESCGSILSAIHPGYDGEQFPKDPMPEMFELRQDMKWDPSCLATQMAPNCLRNQIFTHGCWYLDGMAVVGD